MAALFHDPPVLHHQYPVTEACAGQSVGDKNRGPAPGQFVIFQIQLVLCFRIQCRRGFIQHQNRRFLIDGPCQKQLLGLPAGQIDPFPEHLLRQTSVQPLRQALCQVQKSRLLQTCPHLIPVHLLRRTGGHIFRNGGRDYPDILKHHGEELIPGLQVPADGRYSIHQNFPPGRFVHPAEKLDQRGLACAVRPHQSDFLPRTYLDVNVLQDLFIRPRIGKTHMGKGNRRLPVHRNFRSGPRLPFHGIRHAHDFSVIRDGQHIFLHLSGLTGYLGQRRAQRPHQSHIKHKVIGPHPAFQHTVEQKAVHNYFLPHSCHSGGLIICHLLTHLSALPLPAFLQQAAVLGHQPPFCPIQPQIFCINKILYPAHNIINFHFQRLPEIPVLFLPGYGSPAQPVLHPRPCCQHQHRCRMQYGQEAGSNGNRNEIKHKIQGSVDTCLHIPVPVYIQLLCTVYHSFIIGILQVTV